MIDLIDNLIDTIENSRGSIVKQICAFIILAVLFCIIITTIVLIFLAVFAFVYSMVFWIGGLFQ